jgi:hypothetical protein
VRERRYGSAGNRIVFDWERVLTGADELIYGR